jgi:hypothetical protein
MASQQEWVEVLVPKHLVPDVYGLIAEQMAKGPTNGGTAVNEELTARMFLESPPAMRQFLALLADNAGKVLSTAEICEAIERTPMQLAGVLGAFGRRVKNRYKGAKKPFDARRDHAERTWVYGMDPEVAEAIKKAAQGSRR